jgi:hypothetical protein
MTARKKYLIQEYNRLFDEYLDTLDKIEIWKKKVHYEKDFHAKKNKLEIVQVMIETRIDISRKLYYYDSAITAPDNMTNIYLKIIDTI